MTKSAQAGILAPLPPQGRYLFFSLAQAPSLSACLNGSSFVAFGNSFVALEAQMRQGALGARLDLRQIGL